MNSKKIFFNWSSGKDSALSLYRLLNDPHYSVEKLVTTINKPLQRVTMHGLRIALLKKQLEAIHLPYHFIELPEQPSHEDYNEIMKETLAGMKDKGFTHGAFGDIYLEDLRNYREEQLKKCNIESVFPIWNEDPKALLDAFFRLGFKAIVVCVDGQKLDGSFVGRELNQSFLEDLPEHIDPCGENGEFHTFCYDGPLFSQPIDFKIGDKVQRSYQVNDKELVFHFCDLV